MHLRLWFGILQAPAGMSTNPNSTTADSLSRNIYFPGSTQWYNYWQPTQQHALIGPLPQKQNVSTPIEYAPLYFRGGAIIPMLTLPDKLPGKAKSLELLIALSHPESGTAAGSIFLDDGVSIDTLAPGKNIQATFTVGDRRLTSMAKTQHVDEASEGVKTYYPAVVNRVTVLGVRIGITELVLTEIGAHGNHSRVINRTDYTLDDVGLILTVTQLNQTLTESFTLEWTI